MHQEKNNYYSIPSIIINYYSLTEKHLIYCHVKIFKTGTS